ncbi:hypothetical protein ASG50_24850 [Rhizobium sp. Leaf386]|nr:hypothetical protein ASG50_24850 [Rhizobium sp. Leaf386]
MHMGNDTVNNLCNHRVLTEAGPRETAPLKGGIRMILTMIRVQAFRKGRRALPGTVRNDGWSIKRCIVNLPPRSTGRWQVPNG